MYALAFMRFETPGYLVLLALVPLLIALSFRSLAGLGPGRRVVAITVRCLVVLLIVLALAGAQRTETVDDLAVIFLMDRSKSVPQRLQRAAFDYVQRAAADAGNNDLIGVVGFDGVADVEQLPMKVLDIRGLTPPGEPHQTSLAAAVRLALALLPSDAAGRLVLLSDGNENVGNVLEEAEQLRAARIPVDVFPIEYQHDREVVFEQLKAPPTATTDETVNLQMVLRAQQRCTGEILLKHGGVPVDLSPDTPGSGYRVELEPGPNRFQFQRPLYAAGAHRFEAEFIPDDPDADTLADNNLGQAFTMVSGQGKILILAEEDDLAGAQPSALILTNALERDKIVCDVARPGEIPLDQEHLIDYSLVVLSDVPAGSFSQLDKESLAVYVRELGGGLIMVGGENSFGAGGWLSSPVEDVMPVSFDIKHKKEFLKGALALVMHACEIPDGNFLGERCAIEAVKSLSSRDLVGVLAWKWHGGDDKNWAVPLQTVGNRTRIINAIKTMSMGDLPDLDEVMRPGVEALIERRDAGPKHMIVISDFDPSPPRGDLIAKMKQHGITCTTIAIGYGGHWIDEGMATEIATKTGGRFYRTRDHSQLPRIFVKESREVRRSLIQEGEFNPALVNPLSPIVPGLAGEGLPPLRGFVLTTGKDAAMVPIVRPAEEGDDPVLAHWQAGLGKTIAFTSGMWSKWGPAWAAWPGFSKFWSQAVRWASRQSEAAAFDIATSVQGGKARIRLDAYDKNADALNFMNVAGKVVTPDNEAMPLRLTQTGPGRYEAEFDARQRGNYILDLRYTSMQDGEEHRGILQTGLSIAYSPEYAQMQANMPLLEELRTQTDGRLLRNLAPGDVFARAGMRQAEKRRVIWESLLRWMLLAFLLDVAVRRIAVRPREMYARFRRFLAEIAGRRPAATAEATLSTLKGTRDRVRDEQRKSRETEEAAPAATARFERQTPDSKASEDLSKALGGASEQEKPVVAKPTGKKPQQSEADYTSRLLKAKRRARDDMKKSQDDESKPEA